MRGERGEAGWARDDQDRQVDLLAPAADQDLGSRLLQVSQRATFVPALSRAVRSAMPTDDAASLVLEMVVPELVDWAQLVVRDRGLLRCRALLRGGALRSREVTAPRAGPSTLSRVVTRGLRELTLHSMGPDEAMAALESLVPVQEIRDELATIRPADLLVIPLEGRGRTFGALALARRGTAGFDEATLDFLADLAQTVSNRLDATRTVADSRRVTSVLAGALAPPELPELPGARLAAYNRVAFEDEALGGDFYDVHGEDDDWTVVVGDVCGKGVEASVLTGRVRQAVRTAALVDRSPAKVLDLVNRVLVREQDSSFVTAVCARVRHDGSDLRLDIASAGHPEPLVLRRDGQLDRVDVAGTVLGLFEDQSDYRDVTVTLAPGDCCVLYTDGVLEAPGSTERFGEERFDGLLRAAPRGDVAGLVDSVARSLSDFIGDRAHDDIAILGIQNDPC